MYIDYKRNHGFGIFNSLDHRTMRIAILIKDGEIKALCSDMTDDLHLRIVDADYNCCKPDEEWKEASEGLIPVYEKD